MVKKMAWGAMLIVTGALVVIGTVEGLWASGLFIATCVCVISAFGALVFFVSKKAQISISIDSAKQMVELGAPFYRARFSKDNVCNISVAEDDGLNSGIVNWYVVGRAHSKNGVRINAGGRAHLQIQLHDGKKYEVVLPTRTDAEMIANEIQ